MSVLITEVKGNQACKCGATPGTYHERGCGVERCGCRNGGQQAVSCDCNDETYEANRLPWTGVWPGKLEAAKNGFFCRDLINSRPSTDPNEVVMAREQGKIVEWHVPCKEEDEGARPDLNRWHNEGCPS